MKNFLYLLLIIFCGFANTVFAQATATVSRDNISMDETMTLIISSDDPDSVSTLNLQPVEVDFDILSNSESSQFQMVNGQTTASKQWQISLAPKRKGKLVIPSLKVGNDNTDSISILVSESIPMEQRAGIDNIFMEAELSNQKPWVQEELVYTTRIYYYPGLNRGAELSPLDIPDAIVTQIGETNYEKKINNKNYIVYEVKYAIFPQSSGLVKIPGQLFQGSLADPRRPRSFFGFGRGSAESSVRLRNENKEIIVQPRPGEFTGRHWLPARNIKLREEWSENPNGISVGQPVTRSIIIDADGLQASQLPPLEIPPLMGAQMYPDDPETTEQATIKGVRSSRTEKMAIIPSNAGNLTLPEIEINWWNTSTQKMETASLPARTLAILPGTGTSAATSTSLPVDTSAASLSSDPVGNDANSPQGITTNLWQYAFFATLAMWLMTIAGFFLKRKPEPVVADNSTVHEIATEEQAFKTLKHNQDTPAKLRSSLLAWGKLFWNQRSINSLSDIARLSTNNHLEKTLMALDAHLFQSADEDFDSTELVRAIEKERESSSIHLPVSDSRIKPLYQSDSRH